MAGLDEVWIPLVDEPIGALVAKLQEEDPGLERLVASPWRLLAFRTFAYVRVGILLGGMLLDQDPPVYHGSETWVDTLLRDPAKRQRIADEVRAVAEEVAADPAYPEEEAVGPDDAARARFRAFASHSEQQGS